MAPPRKKPTSTSKSSSTSKSRRRRTTSRSSKSTTPKMPTVESIGGLRNLPKALAYADPSNRRRAATPLAVRPPGTSKGVAVSSGVEAVQSKYAGKADAAVKLVFSEGHANTVQSVVSRLNRSGLSDSTRLLLSTPDVLGHLILKAFAETDKDGDGVDAGDEQGLYQSIVRNVEREPRELFELAVLQDVIDRNSLKADAKQLRRIRDRARDAGIPLQPGQAEELIVELHQEVAREGKLPALIESFSNRKGIPDELMTEDVVASMTEYMLRLGIPITEGSKLDEFFTLAYEQATGITDSKRDPIVLAGQPGSLSPWDFRVERFETADTQGVVPPNVLAAGALDYLSYMGDAPYLNVYGLADALVLRWASGLLDIVSSETSNKLYRYWKLRERRITPEERAMLYKRVLNKGETELLSKMVVNESFPRLWHNLMERIAQYIEDTEDAAKDVAVSKVPVIRAAQDLQFNLTDHATGMVHMQATEMYAQFEDAFELLSSPEIVAQLSGGRRKNVWAVIERLSREDFGMSVDVSTIRTLAVEGNKVFEWIANLEPGNVQEDEFEAAIEAGEKWIIAAASMPEVAATEPEYRDEYEEEDEFQDEFAEEGEFAW